jgi:AcrR family transcriptional regulator
LTEVLRGKVLRGRQAEAARNDRRLLDAAREVFASQGFDAPVSAVAERAGVGIGSLYRRYGSKTELLQRLCVLAMEQASESVEEGLRAGDAWDGLAGHIRRSVAFQSGALGPLAGRIETTPDMWATSRRVRKLLDDLVKRAQREGKLRADVTVLDVSLLIEQFSRGGRLEPEDINNRDRLLAISLDGLRALDAGPLPGHAPKRSHYEAAWRGRTDA